MSGMLISAVWWVVIIAALVYRFVLKPNRNRQAAQAGEDKNAVRQAVEKVLNGVGDYKLVYAHWEERESYGRGVKTTYFRYAAAFQGETLWVVPLQIDKKTRQVQAGRPGMLTPDYLGRAKVKKTEKDGTVKRVEVMLADKKGKTIVELTVEAENLRKNRWFPMNILQEEECAAFDRFITPLAQRVAGENAALEAQIEAQDKESFGVMGAIVSVVGALIGTVFYPPLGAILCAGGLILSIIGAVKGAKGKAGLIISVIGTVWTVGFWLHIWQFM